MTEEQLAELLAQHLDTLLEGGALPADLPPEVAELLAVAQNLNEAAPAPRPEFGPALKASLLDTTTGGSPATPLLSKPVILGVAITLVVGAGLLVLLLSIFVIGLGQNDSESTTPAPASPTAFTLTPAPTIEPTLGPQAPTVTPVVDVLPVITVTSEIIIEPPSLEPGSGGGGSGGGSSGGGGGDGGGDDDDEDD